MLTHRVSLWQRRRTAQLAVCGIARALPHCSPSPGLKVCLVLLPANRSLFRHRSGSQPSMDDW